MSVATRQGKRMKDPLTPGITSFLSNLKKNSFVHILMFISFIVSGVFINFCQLVLFLVVRPLSLTWCRRLNKFLNYALWSQVAFLMEWWSNTKLVFEATPEVHADLGKRNGLFMLNHTYEIDAPTTWMFADYFGILGSCKTLAKKELLFTPVIGWSWFFAEYFFLDRDWAKDESVMRDKIESLRSWPEPFWLLLFPEGTRFTKEKHAAAVEFSRSKNLPVLKHLLVPRAKGFQFVRQKMKDYMKDVYDGLMVFDESYSRDLASVYNGEPASCRIFMQHFAMSDIPEDAEGIKTWLMDRSVEKDAMLDRYKCTGQLMTDEERQEKGIVAKELTRTWSTLVNNVFWFIAVHSYIASWLIGSILAGSYWFPGIYVAIVFLASFGLRHMMNITSVKGSSSSYGKKQVTSGLKSVASGVSADSSRNVVANLSAH